MSRRALFGLGLPRLRSETEAFVGRLSSRESAPSANANAEALRRRARAMWSAGSYRRASRRVEAAATDLVERAGVEAGDRVLDVGAGDGSVALAAFRRGAQVVATDLTPAMVERGRERSLAEDAAIEWREADVEALPFPDCSFDRVLSAFGAMFAPDPRQTAAELFRVARPGGLVGMCVWESRSSMGALLKTVERHAPPPPGTAKPSAWGRHDTFYRYFMNHAGQFGEDTGTARLEFASAGDAWGQLSSEPGPFAAAARALAPGPRAALESDVEETVRAHSVDTEAPRAVLDARYLVITGVKAGPRAPRPDSRPSGSTPQAALEQDEGP